MEYNTDKIYVTSLFQPGSILLQFMDDKICLKNLPVHCMRSMVMVEIFSYDDENVFQQVFTEEECLLGFRIILKEVGVYFLRIYIQKDRTNSYNGLLFKSDVPFYYSARGNYRFIETIVAAPNRDFLSTLPSVSEVECFHERTKVRHLALSITQYHQRTYDKILAIHDWVADNIYYDYDALQELTNKKKCITDPAAVIDCKRSVCQGYCDLSISLLKSIGIPAVGIVCYALGLGSVGGWEREENMVAESNHIFPAVFCDTRWLFMDVTWDSGNEYRNGCFTKSSSPVSRKYFDITTRFLSNTHRLISFQK